MSELADGLAHALVRNGVRAVFGVPGSGPSYDVIAAFQDLEGRFVGSSHEGAAAIMAGAFGRQSGTVGCSISIKGPGLANQTAGIASNHFEQWPTLSIAEAVGPHTPPGRVHKRLDQQAMLAGLVKAFGIPDAEGDVLCRLLAHARREMPGPVHLDLAPGAPPGLAEHGAAVAVESAGDWNLVRRVVQGSARPTVIVGSLARRQSWGELLPSLGVPVFTTLAAKGALDERLPHAAGVFTGEGKELSPERRLLRDADLVVGLGLRNTEILNPAALRLPLVLVDAVVSDASVGFQPVAAYSGAEPAHFAELLECLATREWGAAVAAAAERDMRERLLEHPWLPATVFAALEEAVPEAVLVCDTGSFCTIAEHLWRARDPRGFLCSANGRFMGTGVPMAVGAAFAHPERPVICAAGDGGLRMYVAEVKLAVEQRLDILFLYLTDGRYASIANAMAARRWRREVLEIPRPSWFAAVREIGCPAERLTDGSGLPDAVARWRASGGPFFIEAAFDADRYVAMTENLR